MRKNAIVTGASSGFGLLCVIELAKAGFQVIATMRDINKADTLLTLAKEENLSDLIEIQRLDISDPNSIKDFKTYIPTLQSIDILVNNAGIAVGGFFEELSIEAYREQFETNFFGTISVTQAILPFMRSRSKGKIINMSSISGRIGFPGLSPYTASKHALEGFSESLRLEVKPFGIDVVLIEPGSYKTNIWTSMDQIHIDEGSPYYPSMEALKNEVEAGKDTHGHPLEVAKLVAAIAAKDGPPDFRYPIGKGVKTNIRLKNLLPWKTIESVILKKLK